MEEYKVITITHRDVGLHDIERYMFATEGDVLKSELMVMRDALGVDELMYLNTCNRVLYFFVGELGDDELLCSWISHLGINWSDAEKKEAERVARVYVGVEAMRHLMEVGASIDSLVVGEREILRQLREAYELNKSWGLVRDRVRLAMDAVVLSSKEVYGKTRIGEKPVSIVSLAMKQLLNKGQGLKRDANIVMVGAGQTNRLIAKFLAKYGFENVHVYNRSMDRAKDVAEIVNGRVGSLDNLGLHDGGVDCFIVCTGSHDVLVDSVIYDKLGAASGSVVVDLAVPNNVCSSVANREDVRYIEVENLRTLAKENLTFRKGEVDKAKKLIVKHLEDFDALYMEREITRAMQNVPSEIKAIKQHAMDNVFAKRLDSLDDESKSLVLEMLDYMEKRCIGIPMKAAKEAFLKS